MPGLHSDAQLRRQVDADVADHPTAHCFIEAGWRALRNARFSILMPALSGARFGSNLRLVGRRILPARHVSLGEH